MAASHEPPMTFIGNIQISLAHWLSGIRDLLLWPARVMQNRQIVELNIRGFQQSQHSAWVKAICLPTQTSRPTPLG
jgi:hypothetical protein